jgi:hypothetical protein
VSKTLISGAAPRCPINCTLFLIAFMKINFVEPQNCMKELCKNKVIIYTKKGGECPLHYFNKR